MMATSDNCINPTGSDHGIATQCSDDSPDSPPVLPTTSNCVNEEPLNSDQQILSSMKLVKPKRHKWFFLPRIKDFDIKIIINEETFRFKKKALVSHSALFRKALQSDERLPIILPVADVNTLTFKVIKDWMKGKKYAVNEDNALEVMSLAQKLEMTGLLNECQELIREHAGKDDVSTDSLNESCSAEDPPRLRKRKESLSAEARKALQAKSREKAVRRSERKRLREVKLKEAKRLQKLQKEAETAKRKEEAELKKKEKKLKIVKKKKQEMLKKTKSKAVDINKPGTSQGGKGNQGDTGTSSTLESTSSRTTMTTSGSKTSEKSDREGKKKRKKIRNKRFSFSKAF